MPSISGSKSLVSAHSAPPMRAFQGLILPQNRHRRSGSKQQRRSSAGSLQFGNPKSPIDPLDELDIVDSDDCHSELTEDDHIPIEPIPQIIVEESPAGLFENLQRNWSSGDAGYWEQACFVSFCSIFDESLPPPHRVVVTGLWGSVVLPSLMEGTDKMPQLVAQDIWNVLRTKIQYLTEDDENKVFFAHSLYKDYGQKLAKHTDTARWKEDFASFLQKALVDGDQPHFVQVYSSEVIVPYWLSLNKTSQAANLLHQPSFISKEWKLLSKQASPLEITKRHVKLVELYLSKLPGSPAKWQEALGLYQGWHTLLQQEMQICLSVDDMSSEASQGSGSSKGSSRGSRKKIRKRSPKRRKAAEPLDLLILGRSLFVLSTSLDSILTELPGKDRALTVLWRRQSEYLSEAMQVFSQVDGFTVQHLLSAATWLSMSSSCATLEECEMDEIVDIERLAATYDIVELRGENDEQQCLHVARILLERVTSSERSKTLQLVALSLKAELNDGLGRWLYSKQRYTQARFPLEEAIKVRRQVLTLLKDTHSDPTTLFWWGSAPRANDPDEDAEALCQKLGLNIHDVDQHLKETEIALAQSLEYAALALHACELSMAAMSWLQEALILKTTHLGKMALEVARLNAAIAVVHEDMSQWEASLAKYRECLRIRMNVLSQEDPLVWFTTEHELFHSILDTLASMGSAYRMLGDHDNAVGCYWKTATMSKKEWESLNTTCEKTRFWGFECHRKMSSDLRQMPFPILVLDEERYCRAPMDISPPQIAPQPPKNDQCEEENKVLFQAAHAYQSILSLFEDKAAKEGKKKGQETVPNLASAIAPEDVPVLLAASYRLGLIHIHFGDFRSALSSLNHALHALWVLDPSTSDSSSEDSEEEGNGYSREAQMRQRVLRGIFGSEMESVNDEGVYHALGICRAALGEHDQAVRFHLTALRSARRLFGVNSIRASEILYDAATSYWYLKDYDKAEEFWLGCLRIHSQNEEDFDVSSGDLIAEFDVDGPVLPDSVDNAQVLYNVGASLCALGRYSDGRILESMLKAKGIFIERCSTESCVEVANCLFYIALAQLKQATTPDVMCLKAASCNLNQASSIYRNLGFLPGGDADLHLLLKKSIIFNDALQAHIRYLEGNICEALGKLHLAIDTYSTALQMYRKLQDKRWQLYVASVLNTLGKLRAKMYHDTVALTYFEESLALRRASLGPNHEAVGNTLYQMAELHARLDHVDKAMGMYHEALRIQMASEGSDSSAVALTLLMISSLNFRQGNYEAALEKLKGSLKIRKQRVELVSKASRVVSFWSGDLADDFLAISKEEFNSEDGGQVRKALQDDLFREEAVLAVVLHCMGNVQVKLGEHRHAMESFEESLRVRRRHPVSDVMSLDGTVKLHASDTLHNLGNLYELQGDFDSASKYYSVALKLKHGLLKETYRRSDDSKSQKLIIYDENGSIDKKYLAVGGSISYALTLHRLGTVQYRLGNHSTSVACLDAALRIQKHFLGAHHFTIANTLVDFGSVLRNIEGKSEDARKCYIEACQVRKLRNRGSANISHILFQIGKLYDTDREYARATSYYYQAIQMYGHRYVNSLSRRLCEAIFMRASQLPPEDQLVEDMFAKEGITLRSIEEADDMIHSHFSTVSKAIREVSKKRLGTENVILMDLDLSAPDCWITIELYLLSLVELIHYVSSQLAIKARSTTEHAIRQLEQAGTDGMKVKPDAITFRMLCLIQE